MALKVFARTVIAGICLGAGILAPLQAQVCKEDIILRSQADVDAFACTEVTGSLTINGDDIANLDGLSALTSVGGRFDIGDPVDFEGNPVLTSLDGLSALTSVRGDLRIVGNKALTDLRGLNSLASVGILGRGLGILEIRDNDQLIGVNGLSSLSSIGASLVIANTSVLTNIDGLTALTTIGVSLIFSFNTGLTNVDGLSALTSVGATLSLFDNGALTDIDGLSALTSIGMDLSIQRSGALIHLDGLRALTSVGKNSLRGDSVVIRENPSLGQFCGLFPLLSSGPLPGTYNVSGNLVNPTQIEILEECRSVVRICKSVKFDPLCLAQCDALCFQLRDSESGEVITTRCAQGISGKQGLDVAEELCRAFLASPPDGFRVQETSFGCEFCHEGGDSFEIWVQIDGEAFEPLNVSDINRVCGLIISPPQPPDCDGLGGDVDEDGWCDDVDSCPGTPSPAQIDTDRDGLGDACDDCPNSPDPPPCPDDGPPRFIRGDMEPDGKLVITDAVRILIRLFLDPDANFRDGISCDDAADVNDDGVIVIVDAVRLLNFLFLGGPPPEPPFVSCGDDETEDELSCEVHPSCP